MKIISSDYDYIFGEDEPTCRTIITEDDKWFVSLPYVTYMCQKVFLRTHRTFIKLSVSFRHRSTKKLNTNLLCTGLPNIGSDGSVCMGTVFATTVFDFDREQAIKEMVGRFWMSEFTLNDFDEWEGVLVIFRHFRCDDNKGLKAGFREWQRASKKDYNYGMKIKWPLLNGSPFKLFTHRRSLSWQDRIDYASHGHRKNTREARERAGV